MLQKLTVPSLIAIAGLCSGAHAQFSETEPNDSKAAANGPFVMAAGATITGNSISASTTGLDYYLVQTAAAAPGIYRHRLVLTTTGTAGHTGTIRGLTQTAGVINPGTDAIVQTSSTTSTPPRFVQWYGFGQGEQVYYRATGGATTTVDYVATLETTPVTVVDAGVCFPGPITLSRGGGITTDTDFWVYDENFEAIPDYGNDNPNTLTRNFVPGVYYVAWTNTNLANNQPAASGDTALATAVMDLPDSAANSSTTLVANMPIRLADAYGPVDTAAAKSGPYDIVWVRFTVDGAVPVNGACCFENGSCQQYRPSACTLTGGVYSGDGVTCAAANCPQPGACCLANYSCQILSTGQCTTAGGTYQGNGTACGLCPSAPAGSVAIVVADSATNYNDVLAKLTATGLFPAVVLRHVQSPALTPTLQDLQQFSAVLIWTNQSFTSGSEMGDVMADYVDAGGGVVNAVFSVSTTTANRFLAGRWDSTYQILVQGGGNTSSVGGEQSLGVVSIPGHPILAGVNTFSGGTSSFRPTGTTLNAHGQLVAQWTDGKMLIATSSTRPRRVDLGFVPYSSSVGAGWNATTDGARLMANALLYAGRNLNACYANCDGSTTPPVLNVLDFSCFLNQFAAGETYANCDNSTTPPTLNVLDFSCFLNQFAAGCS